MDQEQTSPFFISSIFVIVSMEFGLGPSKLGPKVPSGRPSANVLRNISPLVPFPE